MLYSKGLSAWTTGPLLPDNWPKRPEASCGTMCLTRRLLGHGRGMHWVLFSFNWVLKAASRCLLKNREDEAPAGANRGPHLSSATGPPCQLIQRFFQPPSKEIFTETSRRTVCVHHAAACLPHKTHTPPLTRRSRCSVPANTREQKCLSEAEKRAQIHTVNNTARSIHQVKPRDAHADTLALISLWKAARRRLSVCLSALLFLVCLWYNRAAFTPSEAPYSPGGDEM